MVTIHRDRTSVGVAFTATLKDANGGVTNLSWQWQRSEDGVTNWTNIPGAAGSRYTPVEQDEGRYLRAVATYVDNHGSGRTPMGYYSRAVPRSGLHPGGQRRNLRRNQPGPRPG